MSKNWVSYLIIFILIVNCFSKVNGQIPKTKEQIDSVVELSQSKLNIQQGTVGDMFKLFENFGRGVKVFSPLEHVFITSEVNCVKDTVFIKEFYSFDKNLIYFKEQHYIYRKNQIVDTISQQNHKLGYSADYYIIDQFYSGGNMTYSFDFREYSYAPEPITYMMKMIKANEAYLETK